MRTVIRRSQWLLLIPLVMLPGNLVAQAPRHRERDDPPAREPEGPPELKLPALLAAEPLKAAPGDDELRKLLKARYNEVVAEMSAVYELYRAGANGSDGPVTLRTLFVEARRLVQAGLEVYQKQEDKVTLLTQYVELAKEVEKRSEAMHRLGLVRTHALHRVRYERLDAEIQLLRCKREAGRANSK